MLIKEYRIPLPLTLEEYRIAQLYMIQKKSRVESEGEGSAVEIIENHPYKNDTTGEEGQYTHKIYHIERHIPKWCRSMVPKEAMEVHEEAWNAYPYTRTKFSCRFIEKFSLDIETYFFQDDGCQENVFNLKGSELRSRELDFIDIVNDPLGSGEYKEDEDPQMFRSVKTDRGPLQSDWRTRPPNGTIMCSYKLCKVEFRYWGMQSRVERLIHDYGLRRVMLRAHRQAWVWQDEWFGLTMEDIRRLEREAQLELRRVLGRPIHSDSDADTSSKGSEETKDLVLQAEENLVPHDKEDPLPSSSAGKDVLQESTSTEKEEKSPRLNRRPSLMERRGSEAVADPRLHCKLNVLEQEDSDDEYHDATDTLGLNGEGDDDFYSFASAEQGAHDLLSDDPLCNEGHLFIVVHGGSTFIDSREAFPSESSFTVLQRTLLSLVKSQFLPMLDKVFVVPLYCPPLNNTALSIMTALRPSSTATHSSPRSQDPTHEVPGVATAVLLTSLPSYQHHLAEVVASANRVYEEFTATQRGQHFRGQVHILGDSAGSIVVYDILSQAKFTSEGPSELPHTNKLQFKVTNFFCFGSPLGIVLANRLLPQGSDAVPLRPRCKGLYNMMYQLDPIASRLEPLLALEFASIPPLPICTLYPCSWDQDNPILLVNTLEAYQDSFLGTEGDNQDQNSLFSGQRITLTDHSKKRGSFASVDTSPLLVGRANTSAEIESDDEQLKSNDLSKATKIVRGWWSQHRVDYVIQEPPSLGDLGGMTANSRALILHSRYWEAKEMIAFIIQTALWDDVQAQIQLSPQQDITTFVRGSPSSQSWMRKTTAFKLRGLSPSHRAQDAIVLVDGPQVVTAKFGYGPLHLQTLDGEQVHMYVLRAPPNGEWVLLDTLVTDKQGRLEYTIPEDKILPEGMYPIKFVVRGDGSMADCSMAVVHHHTNAAVFSIDGSFASKFTVAGKRPKVVPGSVEIVRHYSELGHLIIYISSRPEFQKETVLRWLGKHQFPLGILSFNETLSKDLNQHKKYFLGRLIRGKKITIRAAYGASRDLQIYKDLGLQPDQTFVLNRGLRKSTRKPPSDYQVIEDGYQLHSQQLLAMRRPMEARNSHKSSLRNRNFASAQRHHAKKFESKV